MTLEEKKEFIDTLCESIKDDLLKLAEKTPADWNGLQLRLWMAQFYEDRTDAARIKKNMPKKMYREYYNALLVNYLI